MSVFQTLTARFERDVPVAHRQNFRHLYFDIGWFGILNSSSIAFAAIYATRLGASGLEIGLLNAAPALASLLFALPAGQLFRNQPMSRVVFWAAVLHRLPYVLWVLLPWLLAPAGQVRMLLLLAFLMSIPGTALAISFNGMFATAVPVQWRGHVVGIRNALYALIAVITSLVCSWLLKTYAFPGNYQLVFALGVVGAALSTAHLWFIKPQEATPQLRGNSRPIYDWARPGSMRFAPGNTGAMGRRFMLAQLSWRRLRRSLRTDGRFRMVLFLVFFFHVSLYLSNPLFPVFLVNEVHIPDQWYSIGNGLFYVALFLGSMQLTRVVGRLGNHKTLALGASLTCLYPLLVSQTSGVPLFLLGSMAGGFAWSIAGGALVNYVLDQVPDENRAPYLAWYNLAIQTAVLVGSLSAPFIGNAIGLAPALILAAAVRFLSGVLVWRWG